MRVKSTARLLFIVLYALTVTNSCVYRENVQAENSEQEKSQDKNIVRTDVDELVKVEKNSDTNDSQSLAISQTAELQLKTKESVEFVDSMKLDKVVATLASSKLKQTIADSLPSSFSPLDSNLKGQENKTKSDTPAVFTISAPEGFEDLLEPQLSLIDIYFNGQMVGSSLANFTPSQIIFEEPQEVLAMLPNISQSQKVLQALSRPLNSNQSQICFYSGQPDCGVLAPEQVEVIFDDAQLRADIFVNPDWMEKQNFSVDKYLPPSSSEAAMINAMSFVLSGGENREDVYTARLNTIVSYQNFRIESEIESDQQNDTRLDQLSLIYEKRDMEYQLGTFRTMTQNSSFFGQRDFIGLRVQSTLASRTDLEQVSGSRVFVFLNERSRVEAYKDGQIIDTNVYQAGNIELDTRNFPQGAYNIELKIIGESGRTRIETQFFSKSLKLPPTGESLFYVELGYPENDSQADYPVAENEPLTRLGYITKLNKYFGLSSAYVNNSVQQSLELGSFWLANHFEVQTNHFITEDHDKANFYAINYRHPNLFLSATHRSGRAQELPLINDEFRLLAEDFSQSSINIGIPFANSMLNIFSRKTTREGQQDYDTFGLSWRKNIYRAGKILVDWNIDANKENNEKRLLTGLTLRFINNSVSLDSNLTYQNRKIIADAKRHIDKRVRVAYRKADSSLGAYNHSLELNQTLEHDSVVYQTSLNNDYGAGQFIYEELKNKNTAATEINQRQNNYSLTSRFNLVTNGEEVAFGGDSQNSAGVMLDLSSFEDERLSFIVIINDIERTRVNAGSTTFVALSPYESYQLVLSPVGETLVQFDNTPRQFTLYPGNVKTYHWQIEQVKVVIMQLLKNTLTFSNSKLMDSENYARTDDLGWVQLEIKGATDLIFQNVRGESCRINIDEDELIENVNYLGEKNCLNSEP